MRITYGFRVPSANGLGRADVRKLGDLALRLPPVPRDEAVLAVRARHVVHRPRGVVVPRVIGYRDGRGGRREGEELEELGELHFYLLSL